MEQISTFCGRAASARYAFPARARTTAREPFGRRRGRCSRRAASRHPVRRGRFPSRGRGRGAPSRARAISDGIVGSTDAAIDAFPHVWLRMGEVGGLFAALKERAIGEMAMIGAMTRPEFADLQLDWASSARRRARAALSSRRQRLAGGARRHLRARRRPHCRREEVAPRLAAPAGLLGARPVSPEDQADIALGARLVETLSDFDAGQGAVVANGRVLAIRAAEADGRSPVAELRASGRLRLKGAGMLVVAQKRGQDLPLDMPAIGPLTIEGAAGPSCAASRSPPAGSSSSSASAAPATPTPRGCSSSVFRHERRFGSVAGSARRRRALGDQLASS